MSKKSFETLTVFVFSVPIVYILYLPLFQQMNHKKYTWLYQNIKIVPESLKIKEQIDDTCEIKDESFLPNGDFG